MIKFLKSLFSKHDQGTSSGYKIEPTHNWPDPPPTITGVDSYSYGSENVLKKESKQEYINNLKLLYPDRTDEYIQKLYDVLTSDYWSETYTKKLPKRDSKGRFC